MKPRRRSLVLGGGALALLGGGCLRGRPPAGTGATVTPRAPSLPVSLGLSWSRPLPSLGVKGQVAVGEGAVAVSAGATLFLHDERGAPLGKWRNPSNAELSAPVAGAREFHVAGDVIAAVDAAGKERWTRPLRTDQPGHTMAPWPPLLAPDGILYSLQPDGIAQAVRADDGASLWRTTLAAHPADASALRFMGGWARSLVANDDRGRFSILDARSGRVSFTAPGASGAMGLAGGWGVLALEAQPSTCLVLRDWTLGRRWSLPWPDGRALLPQFIDHQGRLVVLEAELPRGTGGREWLVTVSPAGHPLERQPVDPGPRSYFGTFSLGADGVAYGLTIPADATNAGVRLVALDAAHRALDSIDFPAQGVPLHGGLSLGIGRGGILYLALQARDFSGVLHAVQTTSPGLAATPLAAARFDAAATGWWREGPRGS
jgi:hypothetical protein